MAVGPRDLHFNARGLAIGQCLVELLLVVLAEISAREHRDVLADQRLRVVVAMIGRERPIDVDDRIVRRHALRQS